MKRYAALLAFAFTIGFAASARADGDADDVAGLLDESVVTTATNVAQTETSAPATSTVITAEDLRRYGARSLSEAIDLLVLGATTEGIEVGARGLVEGRLTSRHFLLLIDGNRMNDHVYATAPLGREAGIPLEIVDHVEVILGPGSVLYGSNAMLGVINVVTKRAELWQGARVGAEGDLATAIRPWAGFGATTSIFGIPLQSTTQVEYFRQWGPSLRYDPVVASSDPATGRLPRYSRAAEGTGVWGGADSPLEQRLESGSVLGRLKLGRFELGYNAFLRQLPVETQKSNFDDRGTYAINRRVLLDARYEAPLSSIARLRLRAYANLSDMNSKLIVSNAAACPHLLDVTCRYVIVGESIVRGVEVTPTFDWLKDGKFVTLLGVDGALRGARSQLDVFNADSGLPLAPTNGRFDRSTAALGAYAQQTWDPVQTLGLNAGVRVDYDPRFEPVSSPRLAARITPWKDGTLKAIYAEAFRAPSAQESYFSHPLSPPADALRPEKVRSLEGSIEQRFGAQRLRFGVFSMQFDDIIDYHQFSSDEALSYVRSGKSALPPSYQYRNVASTTSVGMQMGFEGTQLARRLRYGVNFTSAVARTRDDADLEGHPVTLSSPVFGNARIAYDLGGNLPVLALAGSFHSRRPIENAFEGDFRRVHYADAQLTLHPTISGAVPGLPKLTYRLTGHYSLSDRTGFVAGPRVPESPVNASPALSPIDRARATIGLTYEF